VDLGDRLVALPGAAVREIASLLPITPVPSAPPPITGVTQVRARILPVLDPSPTLERPLDSLVVIEIGAVRAALRVRRVLPSAAGLPFLDLEALLAGLR
jgi:chemotaxis signal transduction protein